MQILSNSILFFIAMCLAVLTVLPLERLLPAKRNQPVFSIGLLQDCVYMFLLKGVNITLIAVYLSWLEQVYHSHLGFLTIPSVSSLSTIPRFLVGVLLADFLNWFHHWIRHKVPWFWEFHKIHHSQANLNLFTDFRNHALDYLIGKTITAIPFFVLGIDTPRIVLYVLFHMFWTRFYHGNLRTNLGPLRYILVTPQSHRIHHSVEPKHYGRNFGILFSIWDYLFGTQYKGYDEYPETGIEDDMFPHEMDWKGLSLFLTPARQFVYPFRVIARSTFKYQNADAE